jgi:hypothetical protein
MGTGGKLFLIERLMDRLRPEPTTALLDLTMLAVLGGQERTLEEYCVLFLHANFRLSRIIPTGSPFSIIEAMPT